MVGPPGTTCDYFDTTSGPPLPSPGAESEFWRAFSYEVRVSFALVRAENSAPVPLDAEADGQRETDLGRIEVELFHTPEGAPAAASVCRLSTILGVPDSPPGLGFLTRDPPP